MERSSHLTRAGDVVIESFVAGEGPALVILPSYGRDGGDDFDELTSLIVASGFSVVRPQPRGVGQSAGPMQGLTMLDFAQEVAHVIEEVAGGSATVLGHAFGNQVARVLAVEHAPLVEGVILAAASEKKPDPEVNKTPFIAGDPTKPEAERLRALRRAFFTPEHDPRPWLDGWYPSTLAMQRAAVKATDMSRYWTAGGATILEIMPRFDPFKPESAFGELRGELGERVTSVVIEDAAHALFPEQPTTTANALIAWLQGRG